jgi:hypothetical protein
MVHLLAGGVIFSGIIKDLLCLPRPLSPPLQRITMSGYAALEYGFPSTHSTNAISVVVYALYILLNSPDMNPTTNIALQILSYSYGVSILFGRLYCGMHGFFDVLVGSILGALLAFAQILYGDIFDEWMRESTYTAPVIVTLMLLAMVRTHPEPADDCPCFDDSVAFAGVLIGVEVAGWHYASTPFAWSYPVPGTTPYSLEKLGILKTLLRIFLGVFIVFAWRGIMKPLLFSILPPIFRIVEHLGVDLPRKFFLKASEYGTVPRLRRDDNVIPSASEIPRMLTSVRKRRGRAVSVGPQSAADAYETIAYRNEQRRRSISLERDALKGVSATTTGHKSKDENYGMHRGHARSHTAPGTPGASFLPAPMEYSPDGKESEAVLSSPTSINEEQLNYFANISSGDSTSEAKGPEPFPSLNPKKDIDIDVDPETERLEIFSHLERVRVRYDVEVITKLIVYSGIAWLAVEGNPVLFELSGLGLGVRGS